jgi:hypothetical protein
MTEPEYQALLKWCRSPVNKGTPGYMAQWLRKEQAIAIRRQIQIKREHIRRTSRALAAARNELLIAKYEDLLKSHQDEKRGYMKQFADL